jgi:hypothetical protein
MRFARNHGYQSPDCPTRPLSRPTSPWAHGEVNVGGAPFSSDQGYGEPQRLT